MKDLNRIALMGRLGVDPLLRTSKNGVSYCRFSVATQRGEETQWHQIMVWNELAKVCEKYLKKGNRIHIEGELRSHKYDGQDGISRTASEIHASEVRFIDKKPREVTIETIIAEAVEVS